MNYFCPNFIVIIIINLFMDLNVKEKFLNQKSLTVWLTGVSGSGKTSIATRLEEMLCEAGVLCQIVDGDIIRNGINKDLGYTLEDRLENVRRISEVTKLLNNCGIVTINAFISPTFEVRQMAKDIIGDEKFVEVHVDASIEFCESIDIKGLYKKARKGLIENFTGITSPYEPPKDPDVYIDSENKTIDESAKLLYEYILPKIKE